MPIFETSIARHYPIRCIHAVLAFVAGACVSSSVASLAFAVFAGLGSQDSLLARLQDVAAEFAEAPSRSIIRLNDLWAMHLLSSSATSHISFLTAAAGGTVASLLDTNRDTRMLHPFILFGVIAWLCGGLLANLESSDLELSDLFVLAVLALPVAMLPLHLTKRSYEFLAKDIRRRCRLSPSALVLLAFPLALGAAHASPFALCSIETIFAVTGLSLSANSLDDWGYGLVDGIFWTTVFWVATLFFLQRTSVSTNLLIAAVSFPAGSIAWVITTTVHWETFLPSSHSQNYQLRTVLSLIADNSPALVLPPMLLVLAVGGAITTLVLYAATARDETTPVSS